MGSPLHFVCHHGTVKPSIFRSLSTKVYWARKGVAKAIRLVRIDRTEKSLGRIEPVLFQEVLNELIRQEYMKKGDKERSYLPFSRDSPETAKIELTY